MSAGTLVFTEYMGEQMISCMDRILRSQKLRTNLFVEWNKDFLLLYRNLLKTREDQERVLAVTDMAFTTENFINISSSVFITASCVRRWVAVCGRNTRPSGILHHGLGIVQKVCTEW